MELCNTFIATVNTPPPNRCRTLTRRPTISISATTPDSTHHRLRLAETLQNETLETLEWPSLCNQVSAFTSTAMGLAAAQTACLPIGWTPDESRKLLDQTAAAVALPRPLDFSGIEDVSQIVKSSVSGELASISELCAVKRTLRSARELFEKLEELALHDGDSSERVSREKMRGIFQSSAMIRRSLMDLWCKHQRTQWTCAVCESRKLHISSTQPSVQKDLIQFCL